jgi:hypothetical protein
MKYKKKKYFSELKDRYRARKPKKEKFYSTWMDWNQNIYWRAETIMKYRKVKKYLIQSYKENTFSFIFCFYIHEIHGKKWKTWFQWKYVFCLEKQLIVFYEWCDEVWILMQFYVIHEWPSVVVVNFFYRSM